MSETFTVTIEFGVWNAYYHPKYLAEFDYSGHFTIRNGLLATAGQYFLNISDAFKTDPVIVPLSSDTFRCVLKNQLAGIRLEIDGSRETLVDVHTGMGDVAFTVGELQDKGHIEKYCNPHYSMASIHVELEGLEWHIPAPAENEMQLDYISFGKEQIDAHFVKGFEIRPRSSAKAMFTFTTLKDNPEISPISETAAIQLLDDDGRYEGVFTMRFLIGDTGDIHLTARGTPRFSILLNGRLIYANVVHTTHHDRALQFLEEISFTAEQSCFMPDGDVLEIVNGDDRFSLLVPFIRMSKRSLLPLQVTAAPVYAIVGEVFAVTLEINEPAGRIELVYDETALCLTQTGTVRETFPLKQECGALMNIDPYVNEDHERVLPKGRHDFYFEPLCSAKNVRIGFTDTWNHAAAKIMIAEIWEPGDEDPKPLAGVELKTSTMPDMKNFITKARDTQTANLIVFRDYHNDGGDLSALWDAAAYCRKNGLHTDTIVMNRQSTVACASGEMNLAVGTHEHTGIFYGRDRILDTSSSLRDAQETAVSSLRAVDTSHRLPGFRTAIGDASGGSRFAYMAGFDIIRHETFVGHHSLILPNARGCARAFSKTVWGCHIASMHNAQPELSGGLRRFWLGVYLSYIMGANFLYEEDSLYQNYKYHKMVNDDFLTSGKQKITRDYLKFIRTRTRQGEADVRIAVLQGRYAPPFNGISTANNYLLDGSSNPVCEDYPVFAHTGRTAPSWGYRQPEKGYHLLEVFAPQLFLTPLNQDSLKTRKFFAGSPKGEFDLLPVEAPLDVFNLYKTIFLLSWHTMEYATSGQELGCSNDYEKMLAFARAGGTLFLSVPHFTTRADRELLENMKELRPIYDGHVESLCGVTLKGVSCSSFTGSSKGYGDFEKIGEVGYSSIRLPNQSADEDGDCQIADVEICGAEILLTAGDDDRPLLVRHRVGSGSVYLMCTYAYPGHEALKEISYRIVSRITDIHTVSDVEIRSSRMDELYYSIRSIGAVNKTLYTLNTDWVEPANRIDYSVQYKGLRFDTAVQEGNLGTLHLFECGIIEFYDSPAVTFEESGTGRCTYHLCGFGTIRLSILSASDLVVSAEGRDYAVKANEKTEIAFEMDSAACSMELRF